MSRRGENIIKRHDGRWEARILLGHDKAGKSRYKSLYAHSYRDVKQKKKEFITNTSANSQSIMSVSQVAEKWLETVKVRCKLSTYCKYESICRIHIIPQIGKYRVDMVDLSDIAVILNKGSKAAETKRLILSVLKMILKFAGEEKRLNLSSLFPKTVQKEIVTLTKQEQKVLASFLTVGGDKCKLGVFLCLCTGLRLGELCALRRRDISFTQNTLSVKGTMQRITSENGITKTEMVISAPKSSSSERIIPLPQAVVEVIKDYEPLSQDCFLLSGTEKPVLPRTLENRFKVYLKSAGIKETKFHTLRHTFATSCVENGMDIRTLSEILGHSSVGITLQRYVHPSLDAKRKSLEKAIGRYLL